MALAAVAGAAPARAAGREVAIGDSIAAATDSYVDRFGARLGITDVHKLISGSTAAQATQAELPPASRWSPAHPLRRSCRCRSAGTTT